MATTAACSSSSYTVTLKLLVVSNEVQNDDADGSHIIHRVKDDILIDACSASTYLQLSSSTATTSSDEIEIETISIQKEVLKYLQTKDKYTSLASLLFKSQAFHEAYNNNYYYVQHCCSLDHDSGGVGDRKVVVVDLPRTDNNKPFIPLHHRRRRHHRYGQVGSYCSDKEEDERDHYDYNEGTGFPISISHQYPFVGIASLLLERPSIITTKAAVTHPTSTTDVTIQQKMKTTTSSALLVGLDIVVFDPINKRLYSNEDEFLDVFHGSFTPNEWMAIQNAKKVTTTTTTISSSSLSGYRMEEFYIRWAIKEAYTKAIGIGMGLDFSTFEFVLSWEGEEEEDDDGKDGGQSYRWVTKTTTTTTSIWEQCISKTMTTTMNDDEDLKVEGGQIMSQHHQNTHVLCLYGRLHFVNHPQSDDESNNHNNDDRVKFYFVPLLSSSASSNTNDDDDDDDDRMIPPEPHYHGCACVCVVGGGVGDDHCHRLKQSSSSVDEEEDNNDNGSSRHHHHLHRTDDIDLDIIWTDMEQLIQFHSKM